MEDRLHSLLHQLHLLAHEYESTQTGADEEGGRTQYPINIEQPLMFNRTALDNDGVRNAIPRAICGRPSIPDPRMVREIIRRRQARARFFDAELFADPAWDMLLDLTAADAEHRRVSVTSLCIASGVPTTTALRWVRELTNAGVFERVKDTTDKRRAFISLSDRSREAMANYFATIGESTVAYAA